MISVTPKAQEKLKDVLESNGSPEASVRIAAVLGLTDASMAGGWT